MKNEFIWAIIISELALIVTQVSIVGVSPVSLTTGVQSSIVLSFEIKGGASFDVTLVEIQKENNTATFKPCINEKFQGLKIRCLVKLTEESVYNILYDNKHQNALTINSEQVIIKSISPKSTLKTVAVNQAITFTFNRLPLPTKIEYELTSLTSRTKIIADCVDYPNRFEKTCFIIFQASTTECTFYLDDRQSNEKLTSIDFNIESLTVNPPLINQKLATQLVILGFNNSPTPIKDIIYFDTQKADCIPDACNLNCTVLLKTPGLILIYIGGVKTSKTINVIKVEEDELLTDLHSNLNTLSLISLINLLFFF